MPGATKIDFDVLAHDKASDKLDRIARAFRNLNRDADKVGNTDSLGSLSKKLRKVADDFEKEGDRAGKGFGAGLRKWLGGNGGLKKAGAEASDFFNSGFIGTLRTPVIGPAIAATLGVAVTTVMPAIGAVAAGGLVTAFGAGLAGLGIAFAAQSVAVKNTWKRALSSMAGDMRVISRPFEKTLQDMAGVAQRTFEKFTIPLQDAFKRIAPALSEFGDDLGKAFEGLAPVVAPLAAAFTEVLKSLGPAMQSAISNVADGLARLSNSVKENPNGLPDLVKGMGDLFTTLSNGIATLNDINGMFEDFTGGFSAVDAVFAQLQLGVAGLFGPFDLMAAGMKKITGNANEMNGAVDISADTAKLWTQGLSAAQVAAAGTGAALDPLPPKVETLAQKFDRQAAATQRSNDALTRQANLLLTLSGSEIAYQQAIDDATASIKANGHTHDLNTQKGRNNQQALDQLAASAIAQTTAMRSAGDGNVAAARHAEGARATFVKLATQMEYTVPQAKAMAESMIKIPNVTREAKLKADIKDLTGKLSTAKEKLADKNLTKERRAQLNADIRKLEAAIAEAKRKLNSVPRSKTVNITTTYTEVHRVVGSGSRSSGGGVGGGHEISGKGSAGGGLIPGPPSRVDNHLRPMATGEFVVQADKVPGNLPVLEAINDGRKPSPYVVGETSGRRGGAAVAGGQAKVVLEIRSGGSRMDELLAEILRKYVRVNGGNVQAVLGR